MPIVLRPNEKLNCTCLCPACGGGRPFVWSLTRWQVVTPLTHCQNPRAGCGFDSTQLAAFICRPDLPPPRA